MSTRNFYCSPVCRRPLVRLIVEVGPSLAACGKKGVMWPNEVQITKTAF